MPQIFKESRTVIALAISCLFVGCVTTEEEFEQQQAGQKRVAFDQADDDGDGKLSREELAKYRHQEALAEFDLNSDRSISLHEWSVTRQEPESDNAAFSQLDKDGDSEIGEGEAVDYISGRDAFKAAFKKLDLNGDDVLVWEEYENGDPDALNVSLFSATAAESTTGQ